MEYITKGCADVKPIFVAVEAEDHKIDNTNPAIKNFQLPNGRNLKYRDSFFKFDNLNLF